MADFSGLSSEDAQAILDSIRDPSQLQDLQDQIEAAQRLRSSNPSPTINAGKLMIPNIAGTIGGMIDRSQGNKDLAQARADRDAVYKRQSASNAAFLRALQARQGIGAPVAGQAAIPGVTDNSGNYSI